MPCITLLEDVVKKVRRSLVDLKDLDRFRDDFEPKLSGIFEEMDSLYCGDVALYRT